MGLAMGLSRTWRALKRVVVGPVIELIETIDYRKFEWDIYLIN